MREFDPRHVAVSKSKGIEIDWEDGHHSAYGLPYLRDHCPCATCVEGPAKAQSSSPFQMYKPALKMEGVEAVGNYAIRIRWNDGHNTGIYTFEHFRHICPCGKCVGDGR